MADKTKETDKATEPEVKAEAPAVKAAEAPAEKTDYEKGMEMVTVRLPMIPGVEKQEALFVACNNIEYVIPRGKAMEVPRCIAEIIEHSENEAIRAEEYRASIAI